jgi:DNA polymerase-4
MCTLYSITTNQAAIIALFRVVNRYVGNLAPMPGVFPDYKAPIVRNGAEGRELATARWGMPSSQHALMEATKKRAAKLEAKGNPVDFKELLRMEPDGGTTNIRNVKSKHWTRWLGAENRCVVPFNSFSEFNKAEGGDIWFALEETRPLACFAGIWTNWTSVRKVKEGETTNDLYAFLTTEPNAEVGAIHPRRCRCNAGRSGGLDDGSFGRGPEVAAAASGREAPDRRPRRQGRSGRADNVTVEDDDDQAASPGRQRKIIHIDMDAFYASVEQRDNPDLRGKPVAVGGSRQRGVVAAASYEARRFGVRSAMPSVTAKRQCPDLIFVKPRFEVYKAVSQQIREIFAEHTLIIEPLSLDEAYLDVTENLQSIPLARDVAFAIRAKIKEVTGLNASAGISYNKFLAKLASDHRKPNGQYVITPEMGPAFVETLPVGKFHGIGPATSAKMNSLGLYTGLDMRNQSLEFMQTNFGKAGIYYYWISRGVDNREVRADRIRKSVGAENTFSTDLTDFDAMVVELEPLVDKVWRYCEGAGNRGRTVTLKVKFNDFEIITRSRSVPVAVSSRSDLERLSVALLQNEMPVPKPVRLLGVSLSSLQGEVRAEPQFNLPL